MLSTIAVIIDNETRGYFLADRPPRIIGRQLRLAVMASGWTVPVYIEADRIRLVRP